MDKSSVFWDVMLCKPLKLTKCYCCENLKSYINNVEATVFSTPNMKTSYSDNSPVYERISLSAKKKIKYSGLTT